MLIHMTSPTTAPFTDSDVAALAQSDVARALAEDVGAGDLTATLVPPQRRALARVLARESAVICGAPWVEAAVHALDPDARIDWRVAEGQRCAPDEVVLTIEGAITHINQGQQFIQATCACTHHLTQRR